MRGNTKVNVFLQIIYEVILILVSLVTTPYVSRVLGASLIGDNGFVVSIANLFSLFIMLGIKSYGSKLISISVDEDEKNKHFTELIYVHFIISLVVIIVYTIFIINFYKQYWTLFVVSYLYLLSAMLDINWYYIGVGKVYATVSKNLIIKIFSVVSIFIFVKDTEDLVIYAVILALASFASNLYLWFIIFREVKLVNVRLKNIFKHILPLCQLFIPFLALSIYRYMDTIMIGVLSTNEQVGFYNQTEKIVNLGYAVVTAVGTVMLPYSSKLFSIGENEKALENMQKTASLYAFLSCAIAFGLVSTAGFISNVYLGEKFAACTILLQVLPFTLIFMGFSNLIRNQYLIPNDLNYVYMTSIAIGFVINLVSNYFLIKSFGALGAIITTLVTEFSVMLIQNVYVRKSVPIGKLFAQYIPYVINGLLMVVGVSTASRFLGYSWFNLFLIIVMGGCIYIGLSVLYLLIFNRSLLSNILIKIESTIAKIKK